MKETHFAPKEVRWTFDTAEEAVSFSNMKVEEGCKGVYIKPLEKESRVVGYSVYWIK